MLISPHHCMVDLFDLRILSVLKDNSEISLSDIGKRVGIFSPSAISKRIHELKREGYIKKSIALLDYEKLGYEKNCAQTIGEKLKRLPNVVAIYFILGDIDFIMLTVNKSRKEYLATMETLTGMEEIERSDSRVVAYTVKDIDFDGIDIMREEIKNEVLDSKDQ